jgi:hypothetical protein
VQDLAACRKFGSAGLEGMKSAAERVSDRFAII